MCDDGEQPFCTASSYTPASELPTRVTLYSAVVLQRYSLGCTPNAGSPLLLVQQDEIRSGSPREFASASIEEALTQQIEVGTTIHGSFDQFELVYLAFCLPVAVRQCQCSFHRFSLPSELTREAP